MLCATVAFGQESVFKGSLVGGIATSQISGDDLGGFDKLGPYGGVAVGYQVSDKWSLGLDIVYVGKGSRRIAKPDKGQFDSYLLRLNYVELPLYGHYVQDKWEFDVGLYAAYLLKVVEEDENGTLNIDRPFNEIEFGGLLGISYPISDKVRLEIRGTNSLLPVRKNAGGAVFRLNRGQYNSVITFGIRYSLGQ